MARSAFERVIELQLARFGPDRAKALHIEIARRGLAEFLGSLQEKPEVEIIVDGHRVSSETAVRPFGVIVYHFLRMAEIGRYAIAQARQLSPKESGRYQKSWFLLADNSEVSETAIPANVRELVLTNDQPYARKIQVRGARLAGVPPGIVERIRQLVLRRYSGQVTANIQYLTLAGGYRLKRPRRRRGRLEHELTYPALVLTPRV
jgi:hypothetical protein